MTTSTLEPFGTSTRAVHDGERRHQTSDAITTPIHQTATYWFKNSEELCAYQEGRLDRDEYGRYGNPTVRAVERKLASMEHSRRHHRAYLLLRGLKTLDLRMERHNRNALSVARFLEGHDKIRRVFYPGLESHPDYEVAGRLLRGFGGVVTFEVEGDYEATVRFVDRCRIPYIAPSLGGVESLVEMPVLMSLLGPDAGSAAPIRDYRFTGSVLVRDRRHR